MRWHFSLFPSLGIKNAWFKGSSWLDLHTLSAVQTWLVFSKIAEVQYELRSRSTWTTTISDLAESIPFDSFRGEIYRWNESSTIPIWWYKHVAKNVLELSKVLMIFSRKWMGIWKTLRSMYTTYYCFEMSRNALWIQSFRFFYLLIDFSSAFSINKRDRI
jgi:hypothetical protein